MCNSKLREQLKEAQEINCRLGEDIHNITESWNGTKKKLKEKENEWKTNWKVSSLGI